MTELGDRLMRASFLEGDFILRSGRRSRFYLDKYLFETQPDLLRDIAAGLAAKLSAYEPVDVLAGPELGAVALVTALSLHPEFMASGLSRECRHQGDGAQLRPGQRVDGLVGRQLGGHRDIAQQVGSNKYLSR